MTSLIVELQEWIVRCIRKYRNNEHNREYKNAGFDHDIYIVASVLKDMCIESSDTIELTLKKLQEKENSAIHIKCYKILKDLFDQYLLLVFKDASDHFYKLYNSGNNDKFQEYSNHLTFDNIMNDNVYLTYVKTPSNRIDVGFNRIVRYLNSKKQLSIDPYELLPSVNSMSSGLTSVMETLKKNHDWLIYQRSIKKNNNVLECEILRLINNAITRIKITHSKLQKHNVSTDIEQSIEIKTVTSEIQRWITSLTSFIKSNDRDAVMKYIDTNLRLADSDVQQPRPSVTSLNDIATKYLNFTHRQELLKIVIDELDLIKLDMKELHDKFTSSTRFSNDNISKMCTEAIQTTVDHKTNAVAILSQTISSAISDRYYQLIEFEMKNAVSLDIAILKLIILRSIKSVVSSQKLFTLNLTG